MEDTDEFFEDNETYDLEVVIDDAHFDEDELESLINDWMRSNIHLSFHEPDMFEFKNKPSEQNHDTKASFQQSSILKLVKVSGISQCSDSCYPILKQIMNKELHRVLKDALILKDSRNAEVLRHEDILNALDLNNMNLISTDFKK